MAKRDSLSKSFGNAVAVADPAGPNTTLSTSTTNCLTFLGLETPVVTIALARKPVANTNRFPYGTGLPNFSYRGESSTVQAKEAVGLVLRPDLGLVIEMYCEIFTSNVALC